MKLVIAPKNMHLTLLKYFRKDDPFFDITLVSKEELYKYVYPFTSEESLFHLMTTIFCSYEIGKMYLNEIPFINKNNSSSKIEFLNNVKEHLNKEGLLNSPLENIYKGLDALIVGYSNRDFELTSILEKLDITYSYVLNKPKEIKRTVNKFMMIEDEVYWVLNEISSLIDSSVSINDIYIFRRNNEYDYYLKKFSSLFGYQINIKSHENYLSTGGVKLFLSFYKDNQDINESLTLLKEEMKDDPLYLEIEEIVKENILQASTFKEQLDWLTNKFKERRIKSKRFDNAVNVIDSPIYEKDKYIFILGFSQGEYPLSYKDDGYLNNDELHSINRLNSKDKTKIDNDILIDFINSDNNLIFSLSNKSKSGTKYLSPITKELEFVEDKPLLNDTFYSPDVIKLIYSNLKDLEYYYKEKSDNYLKCRDVISLDYNSYSNEYKDKANVYNDDSFIKLSTTSLDLYSNCPFHYYLERVIKLDEMEESYAINVGNVTHNVFEHLRENDFDFDRFFDNKCQELELKYSEKYLLTHNVKRQVRVAVEAIKEREKRYRNPKIFNEISFDYHITDKTVINGKIDNLVVLDDKYFICIDYKTGSTKFDDTKLINGQSTQLPTYALLTLSDKRYQNLSLAGLYINNVLTSSLKDDQKEDDIIPSYLKLNGKTLGDIEVIAYIDSTIADGKSSFISGLSVKKDGSSLKDGKAIASPFDFERYKQIVTDLYIEMDKKLRRNEFSISPLFYSDREHACQYCPYKDVCYVRKEQYRIAKKEEEVDE